jgi:hypothetical protein
MAGIEEAFEKFSDRLAREETKRYSRDEQGDYVEEVQDPYPVKLGPLQLGANANMVTGKYSPNEYQNVSTMNRNVGLRGRYDVPDSGIALLGSIGDVRSNQNVKTNLPFNPMTGEASPYSEMRKDVYKDSPYSVGAQYTPKGTEEMYSALYNKGGGYNLGYNKGPVNVSYTSNPGLGNNVMLRGQYNFADGGVASMFRERPGYQEGGSLPNSATAPSGIEYELFYSPFSGKPLYRPKYDPSRTDLVYSGTDPEEFFKTVMSTGTSTPTTTEIPTVDPFSGQQVSAQEQEAFANTSGINFQSTSPVEPEITNSILTQPQLPVSNNPALTNLGAFFGINDPIKDFSQFKPETQKILSDTIMRSLPFSNNPNNLDIDYKKYGTEGAPVFQGGYSNILDQAKAGLNALMGDPAEQLRMAYGRFNVNIDPATQTAYMKDTYDFNQGGENNLLNKIGTPYKVNIALPKELTQNIINSPYYQNALAQSSPDQFKNLRAQVSEQQAAARVAPKMAYGGRVSMSEGGLTKTVPPAKGPDSQGVESLFRRRYS